MVFWEVGKRASILRHWVGGDINTGYQNPIKNIFRIENIVDIYMELSRKVVSAAVPEFPCVNSLIPTTFYQSGA